MGKGEAYALTQVESERFSTCVPDPVLTLVLKTLSRNDYLRDVRSGLSATPLPQ